MVMAKVMRFVNGIPSLIDDDLDLRQYDKSVLVDTDIGTPHGGGLYDAAHKVFTLPSGEKYNGFIDELKIEVNGKGQHVGVDFNYQEHLEATTVTFIDAVRKNSRVRMYKTT